jgi:hypothetical protein
VRVAGAEGVSVAERTADDIQHDIERARASLAVAVDQLAYRTSPRRLSGEFKSAVKAKINTAQGKAVLAGAGAIVALLVVRRIAKH